MSVLPQTVTRERMKPVDQETAGEQWRRRSALSAVSQTVSLNKSFNLSKPLTSSTVRRR